MSLDTLWNTVSQSIQALGVAKFAILIVIDIILWRIHPVLGFFAIIATAGYLFHWI